MGAQQIAGKAQPIDAEARTVLPESAHGEKPAVIKNEVVGMQGSVVEPRLPQSQVAAMAGIELRQIRTAQGVLAGADAIGPRPGCLFLAQLLGKALSKWYRYIYLYNHW